MIKAILIIAFCGGLCRTGQSQLEIDSSYLSEKTAQVIPGPEYEVGWLHKIFFGAHWRNVWTAPVDAVILDHEKFAGGLTPLRRGGGRQTKSLRLKGDDGNQYKFRSVDKDPTFLEENLEGERAPGLMKDQTSASHPFSALITAPLLSAVGVLNAPPKLVLMPDGEWLGEFRNEFGNMLGTMEAVPDESNIPGADKVINSDKLFKRLDNEYDETVDGKEYLKARLIDILTGDWDRLRDQWTWAGFYSDSVRIYRPIPRDRDMAFTRFDGLLPMIGVSIIPEVNNFGSSYPSMKSLTWSGRHLDQRFLIFLGRHEWDSVSAFVYRTLTDAVLENAVGQLPPAAYQLSKDELFSKLKSRRDRLMDASSEFYELVNKVADIYGTNKRDYIEINGLTNGTTEIAVYRDVPEPGGDHGTLRSRKTFRNYLTGEIRIYLQKGNDEVAVKGTDAGSPVIRIIGGDGDDKLIDKSDLLVKFYDEGRNTSIEEGQNTSLDDSKYEEPWDSLQRTYDKMKEYFTDNQRDSIEERINNIKYDVKRRDRGYSFSAAPYLSTNPDYGVLFGGSVTLRKFGFRAQPFEYRMQLKAGYAPKRGSQVPGAGIHIDYLGIFRKIVTGANTVLHIRYSGIEINNFFGSGNQTPFNEQLYKLGYNDAWNEQFILNPYLEFPQDEPYKISVGGILNYFHINKTQFTLVKELSPYGYNEKPWLAAVQGGLLIDKRDHQLAPYKGIYFNLQGSFYPKVLGNRYNFGKVAADLRVYLNSRILTDISLALRLRGEKLWGTYPFYESAFLGGSKTIRGFPTERFAGDASLLGGAELRMKLFKLKVLLPATFGIFLFTETGRVFLKGEESRVWHTGYGGGLYAYVVNRDYLFSLTFARSKERTSAIYFFSGFAF